MQRITLLGKEVSLATRNKENKLLSATEFSVEYFTKRKNTCVLGIKPQITKKYQRNLQQLICKYSESNAYVTT